MIELGLALCNLWSEAYPNYILSSLPFSDQNVDCVTRGLHPSASLHISVEHGEQIGSGFLSCLPRWAGEPRYEQGGGGCVLLEGREQLSDLLGIGLVRR